MRDPHRTEEILMKSRELLQVLGLINFLRGFSSVRNHKLFAVYHLYLLYVMASISLHA